MPVATPTLCFAAVLEASTESSGEDVYPNEEGWVETLEELSGRSRDVYRGWSTKTRISSRSFLEASPLRELPLLNIRSRPASRTQNPEDVSSLRAIPWVFAWIQNRYLPSWYGTDTAFSERVETGA